MGRTFHVRLPQQHRVHYLSSDQGLSCLQQLLVPTIHIYRLQKLLSFLLLSISATTATAGDERLKLPEELETHKDGRAPIQQIYDSYERLLENGWQLDIIAASMPEGTRYALPIIALRSPTPGPAAWFLTGIHGEEPAGPNAMAASVDALAELGERYPVVVLPLCNPHGYARNWRYLNVAVYSREIDGQTRFEEEINAGIIGPVTDSSVDELMSAKQIWHNSRQAAGPYAQTVLVFETPASSIAIEQRIKTHTALLRRLTELIPTSEGKQ